MGRPRKPTALKVLHGDFDKNPGRQNPNEAESDGAIPARPRWLTGEARKEWDRVTKELAALKVIDSGDRAALELYCITYMRWREALKIVKRKGEGLIIMTPKGLAEHPAARVARQCADQMHRMLAQFGLTPAARTRVHVKSNTPPNRMRRSRGG